MNTSLVVPDLQKISNVDLIVQVRLVLLETLATASDNFSQLQPHVQPTTTAVEKTKIKITNMLNQFTKENKF